MEIIHLNQKEDVLVPCGESLMSKSISREFRFDIKDNLRNHGTRSICYYKNNILVSHVFSNRVHKINLLTGKISWFDHHTKTVRHILTCNNEIITASWDGSVGVTDFNTLNLRLRLTEPGMGRCPWIDIPAESGDIYSYTYDSDKDPERFSNTIRKWSLVDGSLKKLTLLNGYHLGSRRAGSCIFLKNHLYSVSNTGNFEIIDCASGMIQKIFCHEELGTILAIASPDHATIVFGGTTGTIYKYNISKNHLTSFKGHDFTIQSMICCPERDLFISIDSGGILNIRKLPEFDLISSTCVNSNYLWTVIIVNDLVLTGGDQGPVWIYDIKEPDKIKLKGKLVVFEEGYAFIPEDSGEFFSTDPSQIKVIRKESNTSENNRYADHLLISQNNYRLIHDLFKINRGSQSQASHKDKLMLQLPEKSKI